MKKKRKDQRGLKEGRRERGHGGIEIQAIFPAVEINAEEVAAPGEEENNDGGEHGAVVLRSGGRGAGWGDVIGGWLGIR